MYDMDKRAKVSAGEEKTRGAGRARGKVLRSRAMQNTARPPKTLDRFTQDRYRFPCGPMQGSHQCRRKTRI